ncbi:DUF882 domain-containing protein [Siculibacillus lacustris]|uniref:Murein endopeptidase K n=1 Tax=Siculibacillus lacustris TaxID=1549641 RepID=A0A4Q9VZ07_9HYPH|nr:DUF882 domain-containing protein [Siculibacillus lacustris]TBW40801.1 DUF882 domain-containing protein [Siculibacillus lacustris]
MVNCRKVARFLAGTCLLAVTAGAAHAEVRSLNLINTHTQERASVVFKRDGAYDQDGLQELNRLLRDWRRNEVTRMDPALFDLIWEVYRDTGAREPIHIVCGYRSPATNNALRERSRGVAKFSQHMLGKAMDFYLPDVSLTTLRETGMKKQIGGVGFYPTSGSPFVHMDTGSVRAWPRMSREQLVRLFPDGKTAHLPADGQPLPGYEIALAESQSKKAHGGGTTTGSSGGGLLAALFGGSSTSRSASPEDEDEVVVATPRNQDLRQGPLPAGSRLARTETPPGVSPTLVAPARPVQMAAAVPAPMPAPPVPTTTARGSVVPMPVPQAAPAQVFAGRSMAPLPAPAMVPSRYAPTGNELPPGWVQGPSGRPVAEAPEARPAAPVAAPQLARIEVPLPAPRPGSERAVLALAATAVPIDVALPRPRPTPGLQRVADLGTPVPGAPRIDATEAFSILTGDNDAAPVALGYAASGEAAAAASAAAAAAALPNTTASLPPLRPDLKAGAIGGTLAERPQLAALTPSSAAPIAPASRLVAKTDRALPPVARPTAKSDRSGEGRLLDTAAAADGRGFALLRHPDQGSLDGLMGKPREALAGGFVSAALSPLPTATFSGPAVVALPIVRIE